MRVKINFFVTKKGAVWLSFYIFHEVTLAGTQLELNLKRPQLSIYLALTPEAQHPIAGEFLFGYGNYMLDLNLFTVKLEADRMRLSVFEPS